MAYSDDKAAVQAEITALQANTTHPYTHIDELNQLMALLFTLTDHLDARVTALETYP